MSREIFSGDVISYFDMCQAEGYSLQRGMNFRVNNSVSVFLMSIRRGAPYADRVEDGGKILIYEGHDAQKNWVKYPKDADQPLKTPSGQLSDNGKFFEVAHKFKSGESFPELIKVYEKIKDGIWVFNGVFELIDAWSEKAGSRNVFKFKLKITDLSINEKIERDIDEDELEHNRMIPTSVKLEVWKRDKGVCTQCGSQVNLHFDHILPFAKGGTSLKSENIQLLCAKHNLQKSDKII